MALPLRRLWPPRDSVRELFDFGISPPGGLEGEKGGGRFPFFLGGKDFSPTAESFGVSAQIGSGVVWGGPEVRFHKGSTRVPRGSARAAGWCEH